MAIKRLSDRYLELAGGGLLVTVAILGCPMQEEEPYSFYYGSDGQEVPLYLTKDLVGVRFEDGSSETERAAIVAGELILRPYSEREVPEILERNDMTVLRVRFWASQAQVLETIDRLNETVAVAFATPVFHVRKGYNSVLTDRFYAAFGVSVPEEDILALNAQHAVEVIEVQDRSTIGIMGYRLRVTKDSGLNALDMANLYHEHPLTIGANPKFLPLYSGLYKADGVSNF